MDLKDPTSWIPFMLTAGGQSTHLNIQRIFEAVLIAAVAGGVATWGTQQVLVYRIGSLEQSVLEVKREVGEIRRDIYRPAVKP
jgi:hypothetical protein